MLFIALLKNVERQEYVFENRKTAARFEEKGDNHSHLKMIISKEIIRSEP
jgi:hypothetical protein